MTTERKVDYAFLENALRAIVSKREVAIERLRKYGFVFNRAPSPNSRERITSMSDGERWEHMAFALYTDLMEIIQQAEQALEGSNDAPKIDHALLLCELTTPCNFFLSSTLEGVLVEQVCTNGTLLLNGQVASPHEVCHGTGQVPLLGNAVRVVCDGGGSDFYGHWVEGKFLHFNNCCCQGRGWRPTTDAMVMTRAIVFILTSLPREGEVRKQCRRYTIALLYGDASKAWEAAFRALVAAGYVKEEA